MNANLTLVTMVDNVQMEWVSSHVPARINTVVCGVILVLLLCFCLLLYIPHIPPLVSLSTSKLYRYFLKIVSKLTL